jgi:DNA-binding ferritin-like protein (Dps family)
VPWESLRQSFVGMGFPEWNVDGFKQLFDLYETGAVARVSPDVERVLGRPARSFADFVRDHRAAFGG